VDLHSESICSDTHVLKDNENRSGLENKEKGLVRKREVGISIFAKSHCVDIKSCCCGLFAALGGKHGVMEALFVDVVESAVVCAMIFVVACQAGRRFPLSRSAVPIIHPVVTAPILLSLFPNYLSSAIRFALDILTGRYTPCRGEARMAMPTVDVSQNIV
jgi:hypothetical protein